jgi:hypothetical protein
MFSRWIVTNITSARGTVHCRKTRIPCGEQLVICGLYMRPTYLNKRRTACGANVQVSVTFSGRRKLQNRSVHASAFCKLYITSIELCGKRY